MLCHPARWHTKRATLKECASVSRDTLQCCPTSMLTPGLDLYSKSQFAREIFSHRVIYLKASLFADAYNVLSGISCSPNSRWYAVNHPACKSHLFASLRSLCWSLGSIRRFIGWTKCQEFLAGCGGHTVHMFGNYIIHCNNWRQER